MRWVLLLLLALPACKPVPPASSVRTYTPEELEQRLDRKTAEGTLRAMVIGLQVDDAVLLQQLAGPLNKVELQLLMSDQRPTLSKEIQLQQGAALQIRHLQAGDLIRDDEGRERPILANELSTTSMWLSIETIPTPLRLQKVDDHWHVDPAPLLAARRAAKAGEK